MSEQATPSNELQGQAPQAAATENNQPTTEPKQSTTPPPSSAVAVDPSEDVSPEAQKAMFSHYENDEQEAAALGSISFSAFKNRTGTPVPPARQPQAAAVNGEVSQKPLATPSASPANGKPKPRVYDNLQPDEIKIFKGMSNEAYEKLYPLYLEHKTLKPNHESAVNELKTAKEQLEQVKGKIPPSLFNHPKGYLLSQQYEQLSTQVNSADAIRQYWEEQLIKIRKGEPWQDIVEVNGKFQLSEPKEGTTENEMAVLRKSQMALSDYMRAQSKLDEHITNFNSSHQRDTSYIAEVENKFFPGFEKPEHPTAKMQKEILSQLPEAYREHPLARLLAKTTAHLVLVTNERDAAKKEAEIAKGIKRDAQSPTAAAFQAGAAPTAPFKGVSFAAFRNRD